MRFKKRLLSVVLAAILVVSGSLLSPAAVCAQTTSDLYGTGSADEINIIKLLDMALNKGGISMSPATIQEFLNFWWASVRSDLAKCISNADSAITTTQAFADYVISALENADHYDKLGPIMVRYVQYVCSMTGKSLADIKQLLTQEGTFRRFLLSYVVDEDGNIAGTVDNKLKKYQLKTVLVNMVRQAADAFIDEYEGYYLVKTHKVSDVSPDWFNNREYYDALLDSVEHNVKLGFYGFGFDSSVRQVFCADLNGWSFVYDSSAGTIESFRSGSMLGLCAYDKNWQPWYNSGHNVYFSSDGSCAVYMDGSTKAVKAYYGYYKYMYNSFHFVYGVNSYNYPEIMIFTENGDTFKVWKSLDSLKSYSVGKSNIYYTNNYSSYDSSVDNSVEFTGSYYSNTSNTYSHDTIQNNIDNSQETINENTVNNITNQTITNITNNYYTDSSGSGSGSGSGSDNWWNIGEGIEAFIKGVAELLDFILKLLGDLIGLLSTFLTSVLEVFKSLAAVGSSFGDFLKECFEFLPEECIDLIIGSIGAMCLVGIIKAFKN